MGRTRLIRMCARDLGARVDGRAARLVLLREAEQQRVEGRPLLVVERREEVVLDPPGDPAQPPERLLAVGSQADRLPAPVVRVAPALDQPLLLELVQQPDELAAVV